MWRKMRVDVSTSEYYPKVISLVLRDRPSRRMDLGRAMLETGIPVTGVKAGSKFSVGFLLEPGAALRLTSLHNTSYGD